MGVDSVPAPSPLALMGPGLYGRTVLALDFDMICYNGGARACEKGGQWKAVVAFLRAALVKLAETGLETNVAGTNACEKGGSEER